MLEAKRTLVKSGPELWAEVSDPSCLERHLAPFGSIRVVRTQPESLVVWEGERASGSLRLTVAGFGTRVEFEAEVAMLQPEPVIAEPETEPVTETQPEPQGFWARLFGRRAPEPEPEPEPEPPPPPAARPAIGDDDALLVLTTALDALGTAHHRPFSRA